MKDNLGLLEDNGFSPERNELFKEIIDYISEKSMIEDRPIFNTELYMIPSSANLSETIEKAIKNYALPNGICIVKTPTLNSYYRIKSGVQYTEWVNQISDKISELNEMKAVAAAAWMNDIRGK